MAKSSKNWSYDLEEHPFGGPYIPNAATHLVIGTFPTHKRNRMYEFYYSGLGNMFWEVMRRVFKHPEFEHQQKLQATNERKAFLEQHGIGIMDMHELCYRKDEGSQDHYLFNVVLADVDKVLDQHPTITDMIFTSRTDGVGALGLFKIYLMRKGKSVMKIDIDENDGLKYGDYEKYEIWAPYSPSQSSSESKTLGIDGLAKMYRKCFSKIAAK
jgi:G:T/U-mismatch repair DNA glycosylase